MRLLAREAGRAIGVVRPIHFLALLFQISAQRLLIKLVREQPERVAQRHRIVVERRLLVGAVARLAGVEVEDLLRAGVVELVAADAHVDLQPPVAPRVVEEDGPVLGADLFGADAAHRIAEEVRRLVAAELQAFLRARELVDHGGEQSLAGILEIRCPLREQRDEEEREHALVVTPACRCARAQKAVMQRHAISSLFASRRLRRRLRSCAAS